MPFHFIAHFHPLEGKKDAFRMELTRVAGPSRAEPGCLDLQVFESIHPPTSFAIHSTWTDEAAFELHATMPHTVEFLAAAEPLLSHAVKGYRLRPA